MKLMQIAYINDILDVGDSVEAWSRVCLSCNIKEFTIYCESGIKTFRSFAHVVEKSTSLTALELRCNFSSQKSII